MEPATPKIKVETRTFTPPTPLSPTFALQITHLTDSYMLWIGTVPPVAEGQDARPTAPDAKVARDWACAMPSGTTSVPAIGTSLFRTPASDVALPLAQRLARRFKKQIFLSVDLSEFGGADSARTMLEVERELVQALVEVEKRERGGQ